ncbi:MAG: hypothetical protein ABIP90_03980 [Vicinamibacterales bacterium]
MKMKRAMVILGAVCGLSAGLAAQSGMDQKPMVMMKPGQMMVSGCVAAGKSSGHYLLTNAMMVGMMDKDSKMTKPAMSAEPMMTMSYDLVGGSLKAHVGHKIEVTGSMSKADMNHMDQMAKMDAMAKDKMAKDPKVMNMKLNVASVKMISPTCG